VSVAGELAAAGAKVAAGASAALTWLPRAIAGVALVVRSGGTFWYRGQWKDCQASVALDAARAQEKLNARKLLDAGLHPGSSRRNWRLSSTISERGR
jgi:hypothetical protein